MTFFFSENHPIYEIMWKNKVQPDSSQMTIIIQQCTLLAGQLRQQTHTLGISITYAFPRQQ